MKIRKTILYRYAKKMQKETAQAFDSVHFDLADGLEAFLNLEYKGEDGNLLTMDVYRPRRSPEDEQLLPVIFMIHGGGLFVGAPRMEAGVCQLFARRGFLVCSLSYRLLTEANFSDELADICAGLRYGEEIISEYGGSRDHVYVAAESAGALLAIYTTAMHKSELFWSKIHCRLSSLNIRKIACFSGMFYTKRADLIGFVYPRQIFGSLRSDREFMAMMNPEHPEIIRNLPPMLLVSSEEDFLKKYTLSYEKALKKEAIPTRLWYYSDNKELTHAFPSLKPYLRESKEIVDQIADLFLEAAVYD